MVTLPLSKKAGAQCPLWVKSGGENDYPIRLLIAKTALVSDRAEVLVDAKYNEYKLGRDA